MLQTCARWTSVIARILLMQMLDAGKHKMVLLELEPEEIQAMLEQLGFYYKIEERKRHLQMEITAIDRETPLLLFDASDPGNLGWFSRCQFYVDGISGCVLQTPIAVANMRDASGHIIPNSVKVQITKELPSEFKLPGKQLLSEEVVYKLLGNFLMALLIVGVAVCGVGPVKPLAGRTDTVGSRS